MFFLLVCLLEEGSVSVQIMTDPDPGSPRSHGSDKDVPETRFYVAKTAVIHRFASLLAAAKTVSFLPRLFKTGPQCFGSGSGFN
jgi:hypothetical protein